MRHLVDLEILHRLDSLIRRESTGTPKELACKLGMSRSTLFELISFLKEVMLAPIYFNKSRCSYLYSYTPNFFLGFDKERLNRVETTDNYIGETEVAVISKNKKRTVEIEIDDDDFILDEDIDFVDMYH